MAICRAAILLAPLTKANVARCMAPWFLSLIATKVLVRRPLFGVWNTGEPLNGGACVVHSECLCAIGSCAASRRWVTPALKEGGHQRNLAFCCLRPTGLAEEVACRWVHKSAAHVLTSISPNPCTPPPSSPSSPFDPITNLFIPFHETQRINMSSEQATLLLKRQLKGNHCSTVLCHLRPPSGQVLLVTKVASCRARECTPMRVTI